MHYLADALKIENPDIFQKAGIIQFFEVSSELSWNMLQDYLEEQGFTEVTSPRSALKKSFEIGIISEGHTWLELLENRNLTSHTYDEETVTTIEKLIREKYYVMLENLYNTFKIIDNG